MSAFDAGRFAGETIGSTVLLAAIAIAVSLIIRRLLAPRAMVITSVAVAFAFTVALIVLDPKGGPADWSGLFPSAIGAAIVFAVWWWRISLREREQGNG